MSIKTSIEKTCEQKEKSTKWDEAISDAKNRIQELRKSIRVLSNGKWPANLGRNRNQQHRIRASPREGALEARLTRDTMGGGSGCGKLTAKNCGHLKILGQRRGCE